MEDRQVDSDLSAHSLRCRGTTEGKIFREITWSLQGGLSGLVINWQEVLSRTIKGLDK